MFRVSKLPNKISNNISYSHNINRFLKNTNRFMTYSRYPDIEYKLKNLETCRLSDPIKELERLKKNPIIHDRLAKVNAHYRTSSSYFHELPMFHQIAYGRSLEVFEKIKKTHYVFHHGQPGGFLVLNTLTKLLLEPIKPGFLKFETILRHPSSLKELKQEMHNVEWYKKTLTWEKIRQTTFMHEATDHKYTDSLVSVDGYLASTDESESALSCFYNNAYRSGATIRDKVIAEIAKYYFHDINIQRSFIEAYNNLTDKFISSGNLYAICIPKKYFNECGYLSLPFGVAATINKKDISDILEKMQEEIIPSKCDSEKIDKTFYQVRLLIHKLDPEEVKIFIFPSISDEELNNIVKETSNLIKLFRNYLQIEPEKSSATAWFVEKHCKNKSGRLF